MKLITKVMLLIVILMTPVIALYALSQRVGTGIVEQQITIANQNRLAIFMHQIEGTLHQASQYSNLISQDPDFSALAGNLIPTDGYEYAMLLDDLQNKLELFSTSSTWMNRINLYFPSSGHAISSYSLLPYDEPYLRENASNEWRFRTILVNGLEKQAFTRFFIEPASAAGDIRNASIVVEVDLMADNIVSLLDSFKTKGNNDPFLYGGRGEVLANTSADMDLIGRLIETGAVADDELKEGYRVVTVEGERYLVYALFSEELPWSLVDYAPLEDILAPVTYSRNLFYVTAALLLLMGVGAAYLIYSQVQVPIRLLGEGAERLERGELSTRIRNVKHGDFTRLFGQFNRMAARMQHLIEKVFREELRAKEAVMKQLQSQINPHFLYNSLAFIVSMAQLRRTEPVISMAYSLADYYRYTTRNEKLDATVREEIAFVSNYVEIMDMQLQKITYRCDVPETLAGLHVPRLLFQPIVENSILHGLEPKEGPGTIRISGRIEEGFVVFAVEDDGVGMSDDALQRLNDSLAASEETGDIRGLRNVHQRIAHRFGAEAGLTLARSETGGIRATLRWPDASEYTSE